LHWLRTISADCDWLFQRLGTPQGLRAPSFHGQQSPFLKTAVGLTLDGGGAGIIFFLPPYFLSVIFSPSRTIMHLGLLHSPLALFICGLLSASRVVLATNPFTQYAVDFPDPNEVTSGNFSARFAGAKATIIAWAEETTSYGPWSTWRHPCRCPRSADDFSQLLPISPSSHPVETSTTT
jgi:hypothetical protein